MSRPSAAIAATDPSRDCSELSGRRFCLPCSRKWGLNGWSEALRQELQPDIRVIVVEPGAVATELAAHITHAETRKGTEEFVASTSIRSEDIADVIAFAVSRPPSVSLNEILVPPTAQPM